MQDEGGIAKGNKNENSVSRFVIFAVLPDEKMRSEASMEERRDI